MERAGVTRDPATIPVWHDPRFARLLRRLVLEQGSVVSVLYAVPALRGLRRWYWRLMAAAAGIGVLYGYLMELDEKRRGSA